MEVIIDGVTYVPKDSANTGSDNTGRRNTGNYNVGCWNTGNYNVGDCNTGNYNTGFFCTGTPNAMFFDKPTDIKFDDVYDIEGIELLRQADILPVNWVQDVKMTDGEKIEHPEYKTTGGYLKNYSINEIKEQYRAWWEKLPQMDKEAVKAIPNFDADKFEQITGIRV